MKKITCFLLVLLLLSTVLCGCSDGKEQNNSGGNSGVNPSSGIVTGDGDDQTSTGEPTYGGTVTVGITQDIDSLDPHKIASAGTREVMFNVFEGLVKPDQDGNLIAAVASEYEISQDGMQYVFILRDGVKFSDGTLVTVGDVLYSLKRCAGLLETPDPEVSVNAAFSYIADIKETTDGKGVLLTLSEPNTELISYLTCAIIPENHAATGKPPIGVGPFAIESYSPLQNLTIAKNTNYYNPKVPYLDKVIFKISTDSDAAFMEVLAGAIDIFPYLTAEQAKQLTNTHNIEEGGMNLVQALFVNAAVEPFNIIEVRQALCYAIDRQFIIDMVADGRGIVVGSGMYPGFAKYYDSSLASYYSHSIEKAKELLDKAGYADGFSFTITVPSNHKFHIDTAQVIAEQLLTVGIKAEVKLVEWATWYSDVYKGEQYEATIIGLDANLAPSDVLRFYPSTASKNFMNYSNPVFDDVFKKAVVTVDDTQKVTYYKQLQKLLAEDAAAVFIQNPALLVAVNKKLGGYTFYPVFVQEMSTVYYKK